MEPYFDRLIVLFLLTLSRYNDLQKWIGNQKRKRSVIDEECEDVDIDSQQTLKKQSPFVAHLLIIYFVLNSSKEVNKNPVFICFI